MTSIVHRYSKFGILPLSVALFGLSASLAEAASLTLDFSSTGGTVLDATGQGTGFTSRLTNTVQSGVASTADPRLALNTGAGILSMSGSTTNGQDFNGQGGRAFIEAPGIQLSSLGFTGSQDFTATAVFTNVPAAAFANFNQFGLYVGTSTTNLTRSEFIYGFTNGTATFLGTNTNGNNDGNANNQPSGGFAAGGTITATINRVGGVFTETVNGVTVTPTVAPGTFLVANDFTVGAFVLNTNAANSFTVPLDSFSVNVVPEPGTWMMLLGGTSLLLGFQRFRTRKA